MSARYWVLCSDELMASDPQFPDGLRVAERPSAVKFAGGQGSTWYLFEDDDAPAELNEQHVELVLRQEDGCPVIAERRLMPLCKSHYRRYDCPGLVPGQRKV